MVAALKSSVYVRDAARENRLYHDARRFPADDTEPKPRSVVQQTDRLDLDTQKGFSGYVWQQCYECLPLATVIVYHE